MSSARQPKKVAPAKKEPVKKQAPKKSKKKEEVKSIQEEEESVELNDEEDDEYDQEDPEDDKFIADDDEVMLEELEAKRAAKREREKKKKKSYNEADYGVDDDDLELMYENRVANQKHRRLRQIGDGDSSDGPQIHRQISHDKPKRVIRALDDEDQDEEDLEEADEEAAVEEAKPKMMSAEDKLAFDEVFGDPKDIQIAETDIPERLQLKLIQTPMSEEELVKEANWIFDLIIVDLKYSQNREKFDEIKNKICNVLKKFKRDKIDIPFINSYQRADLIPELEQKDVWRIFNLDIEYGKLQDQKQKVLDFFNGLDEFALANNEVDSFAHYKAQISATQSLKDLNSFQPLMSFYRSYYQKEIEHKHQIQSSSGKKAPVPRRDFIFTARQKKMHEFSRRCMVLPVFLAQNLQADQILNMPPQPQNLGPLDMAREYEGKNTDINKNSLKEIVREMCQFTAAEIQCQPEVRQGFKKSVYEHGVLVTEPTEQGAKELDVCHPCYRVKRVHKKLSELQKTDLFLDILNNEAQGLIKYSIVIQDRNEDDIIMQPANQKEKQINFAYLRNAFDKFQPPDDQSLWIFPRREVFYMLSGQIQGPPGKSLFESIIDEIKMELKDDAENFVIQECSRKYQDLVQKGYFKIDRKTNSQSYKIPQRVRLNVMGAYMTPIDLRNYSVTLVVVDQYGELLAQREFSHIIPPRESRSLPNGERAPMRPQEREEYEKHMYERTEFQSLLRQHQVDLIVVAADCQEAKKLKKALSEIAGSKNYDNSQRSNEYQKDIFTIWGRPEVPKLFSESHNSQKLLKNNSIIVKKAVCLARFEQDPMNEVLNLWSPILVENSVLNLNLHPMQKHVHQAKLVDSLEEINIKTVNEIGIDINLLVEHEHWHNQLQFLSGLGPRKAMIYIQKIKQLRKPIPSRAAIYTEGLLPYKCYLSSSGFTKVRIPQNKSVENYQVNSLDQTRIHPGNYETVYKLVADLLSDSSEGAPDKGKKLVNDLIADPEKLAALAKGDQIQEQMKSIHQAGLGELADQMIKDLIRPFMDFREQQGIVRGPDDVGFPGKELFYCLINETERTFKAGLIVQATVTRKYESFAGNQQAKLLCRLENGLDANVYENDADFDFRNIQEGSVITGRVKFSDEDNFSVNLVCKRERLRRHDMYIVELGLQDVPEEDMVNHIYKAEEEDQQNPRQHIASGLPVKPQVIKRNIEHPRFHNIDSKAAVKLLKQADVGEFCFRPSSRGINHLSCTWKFYENNIVHLDIVEHNKAPGAQIGSKLTISDESFENLQEIVERYITPCNRSLREVLQHNKFMKCQVIEELQKVLEQEKAEEAAKIPYKFTVIETYPQYVVLGYIPRNVMVKELIKVKARGYFFHHQYFSNLNELIIWFKKEFRTPDYQRYMKKTPMPQLLGTAPVLPPQQYPMSVQEAPMEVDQQPRDDYDHKPVQRQGFGRGQRGGNPESNIRKRPYSPRRSNSGDRYRNRSNSQGGGRMRSRSPGGYRPPVERGYGRGNRGMPQDRNRDERGGGEKTCWNCNQSGHFVRECPQPRRENRGGDRGDRRDRDRDNHQGQVKRQRVNDDAEGGSFRGTLVGSRWEQAPADRWNQPPMHDEPPRQNNMSGQMPTAQPQPPRLPQMGGPTPGANI